MAGRKANVNSLLESDCLDPISGFPGYKSSRGQEFSLSCLTERCGACVVACLDQNEMEPENGDQPFCRIIRQASDEPAKPPVSYQSVGCRHCQDCICLNVCPSQAFYRNSQFGAVLIDDDKCQACGRCIRACPIKAVTLSRHKRAVKCDLFHKRFKTGLKPTCVKACPFKALVWVAPEEN
ncbi:MAG: 4Fe-4S binding protein [Deltaproteobacteria bacterium]|jgi:Fe-S-cluster-containing dehydrogenase component|nr:4Fe-4S binding protein [Deltaproteobacteria bacterium]